MKPYPNTLSKEVPVTFVGQEPSLWRQRLRFAAAVVLGAIAGFLILVGFNTVIFYSVKMARDYTKAHAVACDANPRIVL